MGEEKVQRTQRVWPLVREVNTSLLSLQGTEQGSLKKKENVVLTSMAIAPRMVIGPDLRRPKTPLNVIEDRMTAGQKLCRTGVPCKTGVAMSCHEKGIVSAKQTARKMFLVRNRQGCQD